MRNLTVRVAALASAKSFNLDNIGLLVLKCNGREHPLDLDEASFSEGELVANFAVPDVKNPSYPGRKTDLLPEDLMSPAMVAEMEISSNESLNGTATLCIADEVNIMPLEVKNIAE